MASAERCCIMARCHVFVFIIPKFSLKANSPIESKANHCMMSLGTTGWPAELAMIDSNVPICWRMRGRYSRIAGRRMSLVQRDAQWRKSLHLVDNARLHTLRRLVWSSSFREKMGEMRGCTISYQSERILALPVPSMASHALGWKMVISPGPVPILVAWYESQTSCID